VDEYDEVQALGWVPLEGRGSLPFALVHGESLVAAASWAVGEAGVQLFDVSVLRDSERPLLLHDPLCPLTPADFLASCVQACLDSGQTVVGFRPVTDTVKQHSPDSVGVTLGATLDRAALREVTSPVVMPAAILRQVEELDATDFPALVAHLAQLGEIKWRQAPAVARRIGSVRDLTVLEALSRSLR
jgi:2-C-methyl-D-erythritol 4-phosphate cytidylyltransferase